MDSVESDNVLNLECKNKFISSDLTSDLKVILRNIAIELLIGKQILMPPVASIGLFYSTAKVQIVNYCPLLPSKVFLSNHHRKHYNMDLFVQFMYANFYKDIKVIVDFGPKAIFNNFKFILTHVFGASFTTKIKTSDDKFWKIVTEMNENTAVSLFPDRDGALMDLDDTMRFRTGLFAASIFTGIPILDHVISPKSSTCETIHIDIEVWYPPKIELCCVTNSSEYYKWRHANKFMIDQFTLDCEKKYVRRLMKYQAHKVSCALDEGQHTCPVETQESQEKSFQRVRAFDRREPRVDESKFHAKE